jgi:hypothetical protein
VRETVADDIEAEEAKKDYGDQGQTVDTEAIHEGPLVVRIGI